MTEAESPLLLKKSLVALDAPGHDKVAPDNQEKFKSAETKIKQSKLRSLFSKASFTVRTRFLVLVISVLAITATRSNDLTFNFTVICMTSNSSFNNVGSSSAHVRLRHQSHLWSKRLWSYHRPVSGHLRSSPIWR
ncbi:hypothetical protein L596_014687 [Steinernema carpocapsae]|uniref:Uncharacterized protein n=1 Tax=Steinernema carpocapsae TaxID=34508 RepID=A0A4U5NDH2_STECR|nr:hypothetical protein L596_014687 [Steinernema carpocapsae]